MFINSCFNLPFGIEFTLAVWELSVQMQLQRRQWRVCLWRSSNLFLIPTRSLLLWNDWARFLVDYLFSSFSSPICFLNHSSVPSISPIAFFFYIPFAEFTLLSRELGSKEIGVVFKSSSSLLFSFNSSSTKLGTSVILPFPSLVAAVEIEFFDSAEAFKFLV